MAHKYDRNMRNLSDEKENAKENFGDGGWGANRGNDDPEAPPQVDPKPPEGVREVSSGPDWQNRFVGENADKIGQSGGQPIAQRGASGSRAGYEHQEQSLGDTKDLSPRGGVGIRETEDWKAPEPDQSSKSAKGSKPSRAPADRK